MFGGYEWVVTEKYEPDNEAHVTLKEGIEVGNGLPTLATPAVIKANLEEAGFEVKDRVARQFCILLNVPRCPLTYVQRRFVFDRHWKLGPRGLCKIRLVSFPSENVDFRAIRCLRSAGGVCLQRQ